MTNPILQEIQGLSPEAKGALGMAGHAIAASSVPPTPAPGMLLPHPDSPPQSLPAAQPQLVMGPKRGQEVMSNGQATPIGTTLGDTAERQRLLSEKPGVENIAQNVEGSRLGQAHPFLGKLLGGISEGAGMLGDTLLHAAAPGLERATPGTEGNYTRNLSRADTALTQDVGNAQKEAQTADENATAGKTNAETPEVIPEAESRIGLQNAQASEVPSTIAEHNAQAANLLHPRAKTDFEAWQQQNPGKPIENWLKAISQNKTVAPEQQYLTEYATKHPGSTVAEAERQYMLDTQRPTQAPPVNLFVPGATPGTETLQTVRPGQTVAPGAQTAAGVNAVNTPTTQQRTAAGRAQTVIAMAPEVLARIDSLSPKLGSVEGRWNEFMQGKVGNDDPDFAALRSDLLMMSSAVALAHAQGRLPENLREEFDGAINAPKQTSTNLKATINAMIPWLQQMQNQGQPNGSKNSAAPADVVRDDKGVGHRYKGTGARSDPANYEVVK